MCRESRPPSSVRRARSESRVGRRQGLEPRSVLGDDLFRRLSGDHASIGFDLTEIGDGGHDFTTTDHPDTERCVAAQFVLGTDSEFVVVVGEGTDQVAHLLDRVHSLGAEARVHSGSERPHVRAVLTFVRRTYGETGRFTDDGNVRCRHPRRRSMGSPVQRTGHAIFFVGDAGDHEVPANGTAASLMIRATSMNAASAAFMSQLPRP